MIYVALAEAAALILVVGAFGRIIQSVTRANARERDLILNQLLHLTGRAWQPAPADAWQPPVDQGEEWESWRVASDQLPTYEQGASE